MKHFGMRLVIVLSSAVLTFVGRTFAVVLLEKNAALKEMFPDADNGFSSMKNIYARHVASGLATN